MVQSLQLKTFTNFDDATDFVKLFCEEHGHPIRNYSRTTVEQYNKKVR